MNHQLPWSLYEVHCEDTGSRRHDSSPYQCTRACYDETWGILVSEFRRVPRKASAERITVLRGD